ncbi:glycosyltransferase family 4 protein [bacterium]|nr:glycosyltransferase family 4 protein [bacterium]
MSNSLTINVDYPRAADWPPAGELVHLSELPRPAGRSLYRVLRGAAGQPHYRRIYLVCYNRNTVGRRLANAALRMAEEVWLVPQVQAVGRLTKAGSLWRLPKLGRVLPLLAARAFRRAVLASPPRGTERPYGGILFLPHGYHPTTGGIETWMSNAAEGIHKAGVPIRVLDQHRFGWRKHDAASPVPIERIFTGPRDRLNEIVRLARRAGAATALLPGKPPSRKVLEMVSGFLSGQYLPGVCAFLSFYEAACRAIATGKPDSLHTGIANPEGPLLYLLSAITGIPYLIYSHGTENVSFVNHRRLSGFYNECFRAATRTVNNAGYCREIVVEQQGAPRERAKVINPGVDFRRFSTPVPQERLTELRRRYKLPDGAKLLLILGRVVPRKGFDTTVKSLPAVLAEFPETVLLLGGTGEYLPQVRKLIEELGLGERVRLLGRVPDDEMTAHYQLADLFVMPSRDEPKGFFEGFGIVYIEAGAGGTPSIGTHSGGISDSVHDGETGLLCEPKNPIDLAEKILTLWRDPALLRRLGEGARAWAAELDWDKVAQRTLDIDREMVEEAKRGDWQPPE